MSPNKRHAAFPNETVRNYFYTWTVRSKNNLQRKEWTINYLLIKIYILYASQSSAERSFKNLQDFPRPVTSSYGFCIC